MNYDEKLDFIISELASLKQALGSIGVDVPVAPPDEIGGLYQYVRPDPTSPRAGLGSVMAGPYKDEAIIRAMHNVNWKGGTCHSEGAVDEAWAEIEALKAGDLELIKKYKMLDPEFVGFALLTNLLAPAKYDSFSGGMKRDGLKGTTVQSYLDEQFAIKAGGAVPSGND